MGRIYTATFENVSITNTGGDADLFELTPADDKPVKLIGLSLTQISDVGDAAEEMFRITIVRGHTSSGNGSSVTPAPVNPNDSSFSGTAEYYGTTIASSGTGVTLWAEAFNIRNGLDRWWPPGCEPQASQANATIVVRLMSTPADDVTMSGTLVFEEL